MVEYENLSNPQQEIVNLRSDKSYVIQGGAGTGKTVIALHRAKKLSEEGLKTIILVHNKPLMSYVQNEIKKMQINNCAALTYHSWFFRLAKENGFIPKNYGDDEECDKVLEILEKNPKIPEECKGNILIDESQDFSPKLLSIINKVAKTVTCFIDANQSIQNCETTLVEALKEIDVETARTLDMNYRSTKENAEIAKLFWSEKGIYPKTLKSGSKPTMVSTKDEESRTAKIAEIAAKYNFTKDNVNIGIFVNTKSEGEKMYEALCDELGKKYIQYRFDSKDDEKSDDDPSKINFAKSGVKLFTYKTIKGLDFDAIVIGDNIKSSQSRESYLNLLYMILTRATSDIYICYKDCEQDDEYNYFVRTIKANSDLCEWR